MDGSACIVIDLLGRQDFNRSLAGRLRAILQCHIRDNRLYLELEFRGSPPPESWLKTCRLRIHDPPSARLHYAEIESVDAMDGGNVLAVCGRFQPAVWVPTFSESALLTVSTRAGQIYSSPLNPLLRAAR